MAERTHYTVERSKAPMPEWEVLGTHQTFRQALAAAASWQKDTKAPLRVVRVTREVMDAASGVSRIDAEGFCPEPPMPPKD